MIDRVKAYPPFVHALMGAVYKRLWIQAEREKLMALWKER